MENIQFSGSGHLHDRIQSKLSDINPTFKTFAVDEDSVNVWVGDTNPPPNANIIIKKSDTINYHDLLIDIKSMMNSNDNLLAAGAYDVSIEPYFKNMTVMVCKDNVVRTFQNLNDFDNYLIEYLASL